MMENSKHEKLKRGNGSDTLLYIEGETTPFTGLATSLYKTGQVRFKGRYQNGVLNGNATWWMRNGQKEYEATYSNGKLKAFCSDSELKKTGKKP
jgi:antitoxin component YwqK of YwqJK toxin-antitoxin module